MKEFLRRHKPRDGESLRSLFVVLSDRNKYRTPYTSRHTWQNRLRQMGVEDNIALPRQFISYKILAKLTRIPPARLYRMTTHPFAPVLGDPDAAQEVLVASKHKDLPLLVGSENLLSHHIGSDTNAMYCSDCLGEEPYHRVAWEALASPVCLKHQRVLLDRCTQCNHKVSVVDIVRARCRRCGAQLAAAGGREIAPDSFELKVQQVIQSWLGLCNTPQHEHGLPDYSPAVLYRVLIGLRSCLSADTRRLTRAPLHWPGDLFPPRVTRGVLTPDANSLLLTAAYKGLQHWPEGLYMFLDLVRRRDDGLFEGNLRHFGNLYIRYLLEYWQGESFEFVREAFNDYLLRDSSIFPDFLKSAWARQNRALTKQWPYMSVGQASTLLGITRRTIIDSLIENGRLEVVDQSDHAPSRVVLLRRDDVFQLRNWWDDTLSLVDTGRKLGIWHEIVHDLVTLELLTAEWGFNREAKGGWRFHKTAVDNLLEQVSIQVKYVESVKGYIGMAQAVRSLEKVGMTLAHLVKLVRDGQVPAYVLAGSDFRLSVLYFKDLDLESLAEAIYAENGWVTCLDLARRMGVKDTVVMKWVAAGLLAPVASFIGQRYFDVKDVENFVADHVFSDEAASILGVGRLVVQKWARMGRLKPAAGTDEDGCHRYLFRRADLELLRPGNRLTAPQLAKQLGLSRSQLGEWIRQGKVQPISGPGIDGSKHYLFLAEEQ